MDFNVFAFRKPWSQTPSCKHTDIFKNYLKSIIFHYGQDKLWVSHLCSCPGRLFPAEGLCILLVEIHTGTEKFFHQMHRVISEGNLHSPGCTLCLCLGRLSKTRKKKSNAVGMLLPCENCSVMPFPREGMRISPKTEKKALPFQPLQILDDSSYLGLFSCCSETVATATFP